MNQMMRAPKEVLNNVIDVLEENNILLDQKSVELSISAMSHWLTSTQRGQEYMAHLLNLQHVTGTHDKRYLLRDQFTALTRELKPENLIFLQGCVHKGEVIPVPLLEIYDRAPTNCSSCGASIICSDDSDSSTCSHCLSCSDDQKDRDLVELNCENCTFLKCSWNPAYRKTALGF